MAKESRAFGSQRARKAHLLRGTGGLQAEIQDLRNDVEEGFQNMEDRAGYPELDYHDLTDGAVAAAGGDITLVGRNLLQGQSFDYIKLVEGAAEVEIWPVKPGDSDITVEMEVGTGALAVAYDPNTKKLVVTLQAAGDTDDAIATIINNDAATDGYFRATSAGGGSFTAAVAETALTGGVGDYDGNVVMVAGEEALPINAGAAATSAAVWTDTSVKVTVPALSGGQVGDHAQVTLSSDGTRADALSVVLT